MIRTLVSDFFNHPAPWVEVKSLAETAVLTRASLSILIIVPVLNAVWERIPEVFDVSELVGPTLPLPWIMLYAAALIVAISQALYQAAAPGMVKEYSLQQYVDDQMASFRNSPDTDELKKHARVALRNQRDPYQSPEYHDANFLAGATKDQSFLEDIFEVMGFSPQSGELGRAQMELLNTDWDYQRAVAISNKLMPDVFKTRYGEEASQKRFAADMLRIGYYLAIFLVLYVIIEQSFDIFSTHFFGTVFSSM